ncbi:MAG: type II toxin-antitoxin system RelE/ParE family toxin [Candidatus Spechtbacteria bacterium]|nr:type II toxin-antitoxin system RelE/ParE family toxin [Candidatus Spechtbacteria bacterium]
MDVTFFNSSIEEFLSSINTDSSAKSYRQIKLLRTFGDKLRMPYSRQISTNLYELRVHARQEVRLLYCFYKQKAVILHVFIKKSQKTPKKEISIAQGRISALTTL